MYKRYEIRAYTSKGMTSMIVNAEDQWSAAYIAEKKVRDMIGNEKIISWAIVDRS